MAKIYWNSVEIGDPIPLLSRPALQRVGLVTFAVRAGETSPLYLDDEFARQNGFAGISAPSLIVVGAASEMVEAWMENGRLVKLSARLNKLLWPGDTMTAKGVVVRKHEAGGLHYIDCDVWVQNQNNDIVLRGTATCLLYQDATDEKKRGGKLPDAVLTPFAKRSASPQPKPTPAEPARPLPQAKRPAAAPVAAKAAPAPAAKAAAKPVAKPAAKAAAKSVGKPAPAAKAPAKSAASPAAAAKSGAAKAAANPAAKPAAKPTAKPAPTPAAKSSGKPTAKPAAKPAAKPVAKAVAKPAPKAAAKPTPAPAKGAEKPAAPKTPPKAAPAKAPTKTASAKGGGAKKK